MFIFVNINNTLALEFVNNNLASTTKKIIVKNKVNKKIIKKSKVKIVKNTNTINITKSTSTLSSNNISTDLVYQINNNQNNNLTQTGPILFFGSAYNHSFQASSLSPAETVTNFLSTSTNFVNSDRGFYGWSGDDFVTSFDLGSARASYEAGQRLVLARVSLADYRNTDIPATWLNNLNTSFASIRSEGLKTTLLFSYDFTEGGNDATAAQIKRHIEQLKPVLASNADVIPYMRAGFIGAWGEWHSSKHENSCGYNAGTTTCEIADANRLIVRDALLANIPLTTQIGFRSPSDIKKWYTLPLSQNRIGIHNDCFLAGPTDSGTYDGVGLREYAEELTRNVAFGGETCQDAGSPLRDTCPDILSEGAKYHLAWLNINYAPLVINAWRTGGCFNKVSGLMGYNLRLDSISTPMQTTRGQNLSISVNLKNTGWSKVFTNRKLIVTFKNKITNNTITGTSETSLNSLESQMNTSTNLVVNINIPSTTEAGDYDVYLSVPDSFENTKNDIKYNIRFINDDNLATGQAWNNALGAFKTGASIKVLQ